MLKNDFIWSHTFLSANHYFFDGCLLNFQIRCSMMFWVMVLLTVSTRPWVLIVLRTALIWFSKSWADSFTTRFYSLFVASSYPVFLLGNWYFREGSHFVFNFYRSVVLFLHLRQKVPETSWWSLRNIMMFPEFYRDDLNVGILWKKLFL